MGFSNGERAEATRESLTKRSRKDLLDYIIAEAMKVFVMQSVLHEIFDDQRLSKLLGARLEAMIQSQPESEQPELRRMIDLHEDMVRGMLDRDNIFKRNYLERN